MEPLATILGQRGKGANTWPEMGIIIETPYCIAHGDIDLTDYRIMAGGIKCLWNR